MGETEGILTKCICRRRTVKTERILTKCIDRRTVLTWGDPAGSQLVANPFIVDRLRPSTSEMCERKTRRGSGKTGKRLIMFKLRPDQERIKFAIQVFFLTSFFEVD